MDRPEWIAVNEQTREVVVTLTYNADRGAKDKPGPDGPNPRVNNQLGQLVRWRETNDDPAATDVFDGSCWRSPGDPSAKDPQWRGNFAATPSPIRTACASIRWAGCG
jgi:secreted PhoX family phosphatase